MKNNELSTLEKLDIALESHKFYHQQCIGLETRINKQIDLIFQTEEAGVEPSDQDIVDTVTLVKKLLVLSSKYMSEAENVVANLDSLIKESKEEDRADEILSMREQLLGINVKQSRIHGRVAEMQEMLIEMYNIDKDDTF